MSRQTSWLTHHSQYQNLSRWDDIQQNDQNNINLYSFLSNNINTYDIAYRRDSNYSKNSILRDRKLNKSCLPSDIKGRTANISLSHCKNNKSIQMPKSIGVKRLKTQQNLVIQQLQNLNINILNSGNSRTKQAVSCNLNINNMQLNSKNVYVRKRDRYRQIFGDRPKIIYVKAQQFDAIKRNKIYNSVSILKPR